ncbi:hypothetical protein BC830DRAFT_1115690 [Chytriomyces sp. MP71]|nr:hypothetical protein BC830DRAFT_1115690 [Chytriomyces sp. MP71]
MLANRDGFNKMDDEYFAPTYKSVMSLFEYLMAALAAALLCFCCTLIFYQSDGDIARLYKSRKNLLLAFLLVSEAAYHLAVPIDNIDRTLVGSFFRLLTLSAVEVLFLWYQWERCGIIVAASMSTETIQVFRVILWATTFTCFVPPFAIWAPILVQRLIQIAVGISVVILEVFFSVVSIRIITRKTKEVIDSVRESTSTSNTDSRLRHKSPEEEAEEQRDMYRLKLMELTATLYQNITATYGFAATRYSFLVLVFFCATAVTGSQMNPSPLFVKLYTVFVILHHFSILMAGAMLVQMKVKLGGAAQQAENMLMQNVQATSSLVV